MKYCKFKKKTTFTVYFENCENCWTITCTYVWIDKGPSRLHFWFLKCKVQYGTVAKDIFFNFFMGTG